MQKKYITPLFVTIGNISIEAPKVDSRFNNLTSLEGVLEIVVEILNFFIGLGVLLTVIMVVYAGFLFITSSGNPDSISKAQKGLTAAVIGLIIVFITKQLILFILKNFLN